MSAAVSHESPGLQAVLRLTTDMYRMDRELTTTAISRMLEDMPRATMIPGLEIADLRRRQDQFRQLTDICDEYRLNKPNTVALAVFLLADMHELQAHLKNAVGSILFAKATRELFCDTAYNGVRIFLAKLSLSDKNLTGSSPAERPGGSGRSEDSPNASRAAAMLSSPLSKPPMRVDSSSPKPAEPPKKEKKQKKRKSPPSNHDGPSSRTRLRTRKAQTDASQLSNLPQLSQSPRHKVGLHTHHDLEPTTPPNRTPLSPLPEARLDPGSPFAPPSPTPSFVQRNKLAVVAARIRDNGRCVLTGHPLVQVAHIYPFSATKLAYAVAAGGAHESKSRHAAIGSLIGLFGADMDKTWRDSCNNKAVTETAKNLLCMDPYMHALWGRARFGLKPLVQRTHADGTAEIDIGFHWLHSGTKLPRDSVADADEATIEAVCGPEIGTEPLAHRQSGVPLQTGHVFTVHAEELEELPSFFLLEVQWHLTRLAAMCGAADVPDDGVYYEMEEDEDGDVDSVDEDDLEYGEDSGNTYLTQWLAYADEIEPLDLNIGCDTVDTPACDTP